jgi:hypothetical protein
MPRNVDICHGDIFPLLHGVLDAREDTIGSNTNVGSGVLQEEEVPEDLQHLGYDEQQKRIKLRSAYMLTVGTVMCSKS